MVSESEDYFGPLSPLTDMKQVIEAIMRVLRDLFVDHEPRNEGGERAVFVVGASIRRGATGDSEVDQALRDRYREFADDLPRAEWEVEVGYDAAVRVAHVLVESQPRPDTQVIGPSGLEMLVRDETRHSILVAPVGSRSKYRVSTSAGEFVVTVGSPSVELLLRCALKRSGFNRLEVFDQQRMIDFLREQEQQRMITEPSTIRAAAFRLLMVMAAGSLRSLRVEADADVDVEELERVATAFRVRLAYESSVVLAPVLDVDRLEESPTQPLIVRQLQARAAEFVERIGQGVVTGFLGDQLLGEPGIAVEELSLRYLRAIAADNPFSAFMGYYHVLEYAMEEAWFEHLRDRVAAVGAVLPRPVDEIRSAASDAARLLGCKQEDVRFTELRALHAVVERHIDVDGLAADLGRYLDGALDYFANGQPPFVEVDHLDFASRDEVSLMGLKLKLAKRISAVRNAITHSKSSRRRYSPYTDDLYLGREVPLVRIAAEQLLITPDSRL